MIKGDFLKFKVASFEDEKYNAIAWLNLTRISSNYRSLLVTCVVLDTFVSQWYFKKMIWVTNLLIQTDLETPHHDYHHVVIC